MISRQFPNPIICFFLLTLNNSVQKHKASLKCEPDAAGYTSAPDTCGKHQGRFVYAYKVYPKCDLLGYLYSFYVKIQSLIPFTPEETSTVIVGSNLRVNGYKIKLSGLRPFRMPGTDPGETLVGLLLCFLHSFTLKTR